jgi:hypothetical protein
VLGQLSWTGTLWAAALIVIGAGETSTEGAVSFDPNPGVVSEPGVLVVPEPAGPELPEAGLLVSDGSLLSSWT